MIWWLRGRLRPPVREALEDRSNEAIVSAATRWEIAIKQSVGKLAVPDALDARLAEQDVRELPVTFEHARVAGALPFHHSDPIDRMLVAQALVERATLATADPAIARYDVPLLQAG